MNFSSGADRECYAVEHPWLAKLTGSAPAAETSISRIDRFMNNLSIDDRGNRLRVVETIGGPGDVMLGHPFLYHAASPNGSGKPRFMCNNRAPLLDKLQLHREHPEDYSPLELSIKRSIAN